MSMTSHPSENYTHSYESFERAHKGKALTVLGSCFDDAGKRYEAFFSGDDHAMTYRPDSGQANPGLEYSKVADFLKTHSGHALTHCGAAIGSKGIADVWFCQVDKKFCFDDQTS